VKVHIAHEKEDEGRPRSIDIYVEAIRSRLERVGVSFVTGKYESTQVADDVDIVWAPGLGCRRVPRALFSARQPTVATVHGLQGISDFPPFLSRGLRGGLGAFVWHSKIRLDWLRLRNTVSAIISVSDVLKHQIPGRLFFPLHRIHVIPHGVSPDFLTAAPANTAGAQSGSTVHEGRYLLHVSQYSWVKNIPRMLRAYAKVRAQVDRPFKIISVWMPEPINVPSDGCDISTEMLPHDEIRRIMAGAHAFIFPSIEESFGLPVLEAMASGVPVVTSKGTGAGEVAGEAAVSVDPLDEDQIAAAILAVSCDDKLREELIAAGKARALEFTWERSAMMHLDLFRSLLRDGSSSDR
jgi:glycosyltransferase involved in cell wall biosynthesis